jgi:hypothetical protein
MIIDFQVEHAGSGGDRGRQHIASSHKYVTRGQNTTKEGIKN